MVVRSLATGTLTYTENMIGEMSKRGVEIMVAYSGPRPPLHCRMVRIDSPITGSIEGRDTAQLFRYLVFVYRLTKLARSFRPHIVFGQGLDEIGFSCGITGGISGVPSVSFVHDLTLQEMALRGHGVRVSKFLYALALFRQRLATRLLDKIVVGSKFMAQSIDKTFSVRPSIISLGVKQSGNKASFNGEGEPFDLIFVGNLTRKKNPEVALKALGLLRDLDVRLTIVGEGPLKRDLDLLSSKLGLDGRVRFAGWVGEEELGALVDSSQLCIIPSLWEGFGLVALEAMQAGVPVIATRSGALPELVRPGYNGFLIEKGDFVLTASKVRELCSNIAEWESMSRNCREIAKQFSWENTAQRTLELMDNLGRSRGRDIHDVQDSNNETR